MLKQVLFLECAIRSEGLTDLPLHERTAVDDRLPLEAGELFDQPAQVRLPTYLSVDYETIAPHVPDWELAATLAPRPEQAELLPHLVDDLSFVRTCGEGGARADTADRSTSVTPSNTTDEAEMFFRSGGADSPVGDGWTVDNSVDLRTPDADVLETVWGGDGVPVGASKVTRTAYENRLGRQPDPPPIAVGVVCNDDQMCDELDVTELYDGEKLPMDVSTYRNLSRMGLRTLVESGDVDMLHYIGHAEPDGLHCADGTLSLVSVDDTNVEAFVLNACRSFDQGRALIEAGAIGGLVTRQRIPTEAAAEVGRRVAELLNLGYSLRAVADVLRGTTDTGDLYQIVGDGGHTVAQQDGGVSVVHELSPVDGALSTATEFDLRVQGYPSKLGVGGVFHPHSGDFEHYLLGNRTPQTRFERDSLVEFLTQGPEPVIVRPDECHETNLYLSTVLAEELRSDG